MQVRPFRQDARLSSFPFRTAKAPEYVILRVECCRNLELYFFLIELLYYVSETRRYIDGRDRAGGKAEAALDAVNGTIDGITKTAVFFLLPTGFL